MKLTKSKLKQLIKEEIKAVREGERYFGGKGLFGGKYDDKVVDIFDPSTYEGMFVSRYIDNFEESLREFISAYLDEKGQKILGNNKIKKLKTAVMTALEGAEEADPDARVMVKAALENIEADNRTEI
jgi:hypothetical protein